MQTISQTVPQLLQQIVARFGDKPAIREGDRQISYRQLDDLRWQAARAFLAAGINKGDRIAIWAPNISEWIVATLGLESIGAVLVPLNTRMKGAEAADIINRSGARLLLTVAEFAASPTTMIRYPELLAGEVLAQLEATILLQGEGEGLQAWQAFLQQGDAISQAEVEAAAAAVGADDIMDMLFTSGTTGKPKGVMCAHAQNIRVVDTWANTVGLQQDDNYLIINPFFHSFGYKAGWLAALVKGATIFPVLSFDLDKVLAQIAADRISMLPGPPTIYQSILAHPAREQFDLSSLRLAVTGAAAVPVELVKKMRSVLGFKTVVTAYGLTETCGFVSICRPEDDAEIIATTSGRAMDGVEVKCVDGDGNDVARGEAGEIWVRGYNVMKGYFDNDQATREAITADGWLKTGDVGVMDANGYLKITDRIKDMYISGGFNVYPAEIENALAAIDDVVQAAVIGVADERMGEVGKAFLVKKPGSALSETEVLAFCKQQLANYKIPRSVVFIDAMPVNAAGKILKTELRQHA
ncbi:MAG TPA: FadD3 family acyl-CoA ligase [Pseudomonadales bacterium]